MFRVTALKSGVATKDIEEFPSEAALIKALRSCVGREYLDSVQQWLYEGHHEPLLINESSIYADYWEYIP